MEGLQINFELISLALLPPAVSVEYKIYKIINFKNKMIDKIVIQFLNILYVI